MPFTMRESDKKGLLWGVIVAILAMCTAVWILGHVIGQLIDAPPEQEHLHIQHADGVQCVVYKAPKRGGVSCNWEKHNAD